MDRENKYYIYVRSVLFLVIFIVLHYLYKWFPNVVVSLFSGINESVYQHFKIGFYSYLILTIIEFTVFRKKIDDRKNFFFSHLLSAIIIPWIIFILFLIAAMFFGERHFIIELIYAITITYLTALCTSIFEQEIKEIEFSKRFKWLMLIFLVILIMEFTIFTFNLPWHDIFADPYA